TASTASLSASGRCSTSSAPTAPARHGSGSSGRTAAASASGSSARGCAMPDPLTASERALIDAALSAGRVQRIPTGVSGEALYRWDGKDLVSEQPRRWKPLYRKRKSPVRGRDPKVQ